MEIAKRRTDEVEGTTYISALVRILESQVGFVIDRYLVPKLQLPNSLFFKIAGACTRG